MKSKTEHILTLTDIERLELRIAINHILEEYSQIQENEYSEKLDEFLSLLNTA